MPAGENGFPQDQNFWQLTSIQSVSIGLAGILLGQRLAQEIGHGRAITSIIVGNLLLWLIGLSMVAMSAKKRTNFIQNITQYLGQWGGVIIGLVFLLAFLVWFALQLSSTVAELSKLAMQFNLGFHAMQSRIGAIIGIFIALLSLGGIQWIKNISTYSFPFLIAYLLYTAFRFGIQGSPADETLGLPSLLGVTSVVGYNLGAMVNLPTFFRHARSYAHAMLALTLILLFFTALELYSIWFVPINYSSDSLFDAIFFVCIIILIGAASNLINIYFASACWEVIVPFTSKTAGYILIGLIGTMIFIGVQDANWIIFVEELFVGAVGCLGIALLATFVIQLVTKAHRVRPWERVAGILCWGIGLVAVVLTQIHAQGASGLSLAFGVLTTLIAILVFLFVEETGWAACMINRKV
ncbi:MAG: hypothetical protein AB7M93_30005 [Candidatus Obscuribacterales bacterium]